MNFIKFRDIWFNASMVYSVEIKQRGSVQDGYYVVMKIAQGDTLREYYSEPRILQETQTVHDALLIALRSGH